MHHVGLKPFSLHPVVPSQGNQILPYPCKTDQVDGCDAKFVPRLDNSTLENPCGAHETMLGEEASERLTYISY